jgi:molecular chaperone DnaK
VKAMDKATGREQKIVIQSSSGLSETEIQRMVHEAEQHAADDARRREEVELKNHADNAAYAAEQMLRESGDRIPSDIKLEIENQAQAIRQALQQDDTATLRSAMEVLQAAMQRAGTAVYSGGSGTQDDGHRDTPEGTVEGEFREVA